MVDKKKTDGVWVERSSKKNLSFSTSPDTDGLSASLEGLKNIADKAMKERKEKETAGLVDRVKEAGETCC